MRIYPMDDCHDWDVWHCRRCVEPRDILWIDSESCRWAQFQHAEYDGVELVVHQADRIHIFDQRRLVLIDPVATAEPSRVSRR